MFLAGFLAFNKCKYFGTSNQVKTRKVGSDLTSNSEKKMFVFLFSVCKYLVSTVNKCINTLGTLFFVLI